MEAYQFVAWDSEGVTDGGHHRLTFLANSRGNELVLPDDGNHAQHIFPFLLEHAKTERGIVHVFYYASYDWTMFLKGLEIRELRRIHEAEGNKYVRLFSIRPPEKACPRQASDRGDCYYEVSTMGRKSFRVRLVRSVEMYSPERGIHHKNTTIKTAMFVDCAAFYQQSFVRAIECNLGTDYPELQMIREGKARRGEATSLTDEDKAYCRAELRALVALMNKLRDELVAAGIPIKNFWGAGAIASTLLGDNGMREHLGSRESDRAEGLEDAFVSAFAGARIEMLKYGYHTGSLYDYDLASCYPSIIATLPSFSPDHGEWVHHDALTIEQFRALSPFSVARVRYAGKAGAPYYPLFHRSRRKSIFFPRYTMGWKHHSEILAALDAPGILACEHLSILEAWEWRVGSTDESPWSRFVRDKYAQRADLKTRYGKGGPEKQLKLGLNSLYGKLAQRVGWQKGKAKTDEPRMPTYQHLFAAGFITAGARARLFRRTWLNPESVISFATDGLTATAPLHTPGEPGLNSGDLGTWELNEYDEGLFLQAGVYWLGKDGKSQKNQTRGFRMPGDAQHFYDVVTAAWERGYDHLYVPATIFYTAGIALARQEPLDYYGEWGKIPRRMSLTCLGSKRKLSTRRKNNKPSRGLIATLPREPWECDSASLVDGDLGEWHGGIFYPESYPSPAEWLDDWGGAEELAIAQSVDIAANARGESFDTAG